MSSQMSRSGSSQRNKSQTEGSQTGARSNYYSKEQLEAAITNVTSYLLIDAKSKRKFRKDDIVTNALNKSAKQYSVIMSRVKINLSDIFGLQIANVPDSKDNSFIIVNKHIKRFKQLTQELDTTEDSLDNLILTMVLCCIFMNRGQMIESELLSFLEKTGLLNNTTYHRFSGHKMKEHITKLIRIVFVKQMYLDAKVIDRQECTHLPLPEENETRVTVLQWGYRTYLEVDVEEIVRYMEEIYDGKRPPGFPVSYYMQTKSKQNKLRKQATDTEDQGQS